MTRHAARHALGYEKHRRAAVWDRSGHWIGATTGGEARRAILGYPDLSTDLARQRLTVGHALTMTLGTEWDEMTIPYTDPRNSEIAMDRAADRYRYILECPVVEPPGLHWTYNGGATALLARLTAKGTGRPLEDLRAKRCLNRWA